MLRGGVGESRRGEYAVVGRGGVHDLVNALENIFKEVVESSGALYVGRETGGGNEKIEEVASDAGKILCSFAVQLQSLI